MNNLTFLAAAYGIIWLALFIYIFSLDRKQKKLARSIDILEKSLEKK